MGSHRRSIDRSHCSYPGCGVLLTADNTYARSDTTNGLHALCIEHYLDRQKERNKRTCGRYTVLVRRGSSSVRVYFNTVDERRSFIVNRRIQARWSRTLSRQSILVEGRRSADGFPDHCEECDGVLRYDKRGFLVCEDCGLVCDVTPFWDEESTDLFKGRHSFNGESADSQIYDVYYSRAYGRG